MDARERSLISRIGGLARSAQYGAEVTLPARQAFLARFERQVDPQKTLPEAERARRAEAAKRAYFAKLALRSAQSRRKRAAKPGIREVR